jgi:hypothetical protein
MQVRDGVIPWRGYDREIVNIVGRRHSRRSCLALVVGAAHPGVSAKGATYGRTESTADFGKATTQTIHKLGRSVGMFRVLGRGGDHPTVGTVLEATAGSTEHGILFGLASAQPPGNYHMDAGGGKVSTAARWFGS